MKKLIVLSGNSDRNQAWGEGAVEHFQSWFDAVHMLYYNHWGTDSNVMDVDAELRKLEGEVKSDSDETEYVVIAKSIGTILTLLAIHQKIVKPIQCVFFGMPLNFAGEEGGAFEEDWSPLSHYSVPTLAFHNVDDPVANCQLAEGKLDELGVGNIQFVKVPGDNHNYTEFLNYQERIKEFLNT